ncbi:MAG TPA: hypothetical protein VFB67_08555 [Candidatus Polarisedimenticolaceae bacterium]|nr:hypothetical protein [Candidatus Polarisedimenticolaceae bacterium]
MEFLRTHPFTTLAIVLAVALPLVAWLILRRMGPTPNQQKADRMLRISGVVLMVLGVGRTVLNIVDGRFPPDIFFFIGLFAWWYGSAMRRAGDPSDSTSQS